MVHTFHGEDVWFGYWVLRPSVLPFDGFLAMVDTPRFIPGQPRNYNSPLRSTLHSMVRKAESIAPDHTA